MKKITTIILAVAISAQLSVFSATTGSLVLTGTVSGIMDLTVTPEPSASALDLINTQIGLKVATVNEKSNKAAGYTIKLESASAIAAGSDISSLIGTVGNSDTIDYALHYDSNFVVFENGIATITDSTQTTSASGVDKDLTISYSGDNSLSEGSYSDTLTFTIAAK